MDCLLAQEMEAAMIKWISDCKPLVESISICSQLSKFDDLDGMLKSCRPEVSKQVKE